MKQRRRSKKLGKGELLEEKIEEKTEAMEEKDQK